MYNYLISVNERDFYITKNKYPFKAFIVSLLSAIGRGAPANLTEVESIFHSMKLSKILSGIKTEQSFVLSSASDYKYIKYLVKDGLLIFSDNNYSFTISVPSKVISIQVKTNDVLITSMISFKDNPSNFKSALDKYFASIDEVVEHNPQKQILPIPDNKTTKVIRPVPNNDTKKPSYNATTPKTSVLNNSDSNKQVNNITIEESVNIENYPDVDNENEILNSYINTEMDNLIKNNLTTQQEE